MFSKKLFSAQKASQAFWASRANEIADEVFDCNEVLRCEDYFGNPVEHSAEVLAEAERRKQGAINKLRKLIPELEGRNLRFVRGLCVR